MATQGQVTKIYQLKTLGYPELTKQLDGVSKKFVEIKKAKQAAEGKLAGATDIADIQKYIDEVQKLKIEEQQLRTERQRMINEQKAANIQRQAAIELQKKQKAENIGEAGSIAAIRKEIKELNAALILKNQTGSSTVSFQGQNLTIDQTIAKLKELTSAEQAFRRQFQRDQTLVGEYTTGIVQAFKQMGLDDLVGGQVTRTQNRLNELNSDFDRLQKELKETQAAGLGTDTIEKQMIENRNEVIKLDTELARLRKDLRGTGDVGNQITSSIKNGFSSLKGQVTSFALQYVGFTALFNKITNEISEGIGEANKIEGVTAAFANLNRPGLLDNLRTATRGTVSDLELMQRAVQASNFQIPLETLGGLLDFARRRAKDTGQEVGFLVDSIVTGIGRKSPLILDNLGISAVRLREKLKGISEETVDIGAVAKAVSEIITEENAKVGKEVDTTSERISQNRAQWQNIRAEFTANLLPALATLGTFFLFIITNLPTIITLVGLLAAGWAISNGQLIIQNAQLLYYNLLIVRNYAALGLLSVAQIAYNGVLFIFNGLLKGATIALRLFGVTAATAAGPLRIILTVASLLGAAFLGLSKAMGEGARSIDASTRSLRAMNDLHRESSRIYTEQIAKIDSWVAVIKSGTTSVDTKKRAVEELTKINAEFGKVIRDNTVDLVELEKAYKKVTDAIIKQANAEASAKLTAQKQARATTLAAARQEIEIATATGRDFVIDTKDTDLPDEVVKAVKELKGVTVVKNLFGGSTIAVTQKQLQTILSDLKLKQEAAAEEVKTYFEIQTKAEEDLKKFVDGQTSNAQVFQVDIEALRKQIEALDKEINSFKGTEADLAKKVKDRSDLQKRLDTLLGNNKPTRDRGSRLTGVQKDAIKDIEAIRDQLNAIDEKRRLQSEIDEETYLDNVYASNVNAINQKLKLLTGANAEERKQIADLNLEKVKLEQDLNDKLYELRAKALKDQLDITVKNAQEEADRIKNDPDVNISDTTRAQAQLDADNKILAAQLLFNQQMDQLEKNRNNLSKKNAEDRARDLRVAQQAINDDQKKLLLAQIDDVLKAGEKLQAEFELAIDRAILLIQADNSLSQSQKNARIRTLENQRQFGILVRQAALYKGLEQVFKKALDAGIVTLAQYEEVVKKLQELQQQLEKTPEFNGRGFFDGIKINFGESITDFLSRAAREFAAKIKTLFGKELSKEQSDALGQAMADAISQSYQLAADVMNSYFDAEEARIRDNLDLQLERIDMEREQVIARAQSQAEIDSLEKQYDAKKKAAERKAQEDMRRSRRSEAKLALAAELANIWASVWQLGPIAGPIAGAIFSGLALGRYAIRLNEINREKFEFGGQPGEVPIRGGQFGGKPHSKGGTDFSFKGQAYNAEVKELAVVRTKDAAKHKRYTVSGTQMEIASAANVIGGGVNFKPGAKLKKMETGGYLGQSLQPPVFQAAGSNMFINNTGGITEEKMDELLQVMQDSIDATNARFDRLKVYQATQTVTDAQKKMVQQSSVGTL